MESSSALVKLSIGMALLLQAVAGEASELKVLSTGVLRPVLTQLAPQFEGEAGYRARIEYGMPTVLKPRIETGEPFDVAILYQPPVIDDLIQRGKIANGTRIDLAKTGIGVGVRKGAPRPNIATSDALKRALLKAKSVVYTEGGASGAHFLSILDRLDIAVAMRGRLRATNSGVNSVAAVEKGEAEMVVVGITFITLASGVELAGWLPPEFQAYVVFAGGVGTAAKEPNAGKSFLQFLTMPKSTAAFKAKGFELAAQ